MTVFSSGISMYAMAKLLNALLGWNFDVSLWASASIVLAYVFLGGLTSAVYNEALQFFLIVLGFAPLAFLGLRDCGGWSGLVERLDLVAAGSHNLQGQPFAAGAWVSTWSHLGTAGANPMGVEWFGMTMGLGFVLSFGYWCTDFLIVQRAMVAQSESAARRVPLIAAVPKTFFPFLVILPGMIAIALTFKAGQSGFALPAKGTAYDYDMTIPLMLQHYYPSGLLGLGLTALMASFMSGMAGNVTAFNTVWTYDIYQTHLAAGKSDAHYLWMGRVATVAGIVLSVLTAYMALRFNNIMDMLQLIFAFVNAPLFATFLLGMFWARTTGHGAFVGLLAGTLAAAAHHGLTTPVGAESLVKGGWLGAVAHVYPSEMAQNFWTAIWSWSTCFTVTIAVSLMTRRTQTDAELRGLVYGLTERRGEGHLPWYERPLTLGAIVLALALAVNLAFA